MQLPRGDCLLGEGLPLEQDLFVQSRIACDVKNEAPRETSDVGN